MVFYRWSGSESAGMLPRQLVKKITRYSLPSVYKALPAMSAADLFNSLRNCVEDTARQVAERHGSILSAKQCEDLSSKLSKAFGNIKELELVFPYEALEESFRPALEEFLRIVEEAKKLVDDCSRKDWLKASVFQIRNEEAFREILLKLGLCYNVIYDKAMTMSLARGGVLEVEDLCSLPPDSAFGPALEGDVLIDQQTLQRRLEEVTKTVRTSNDVILARYLLRRLSAPAMSEERSPEVSSIMYDASTLQVRNKQLKATWGWRSEPLLKGSGADGVNKTKWLGIDCAKKIWGIELHPIFGKEAAILASINHPNIVKFFCCGKCTVGHEEQYFIGMELMERSLSNLIEKLGKVGRSFPMHVALDIILQIARGMLYMHEFGTAHRDLKPQNVGVSKARNGFFRVKLLDFGLSKIKVQVSKSNTVTNINTGTTIYRAPEAFEYAKAASRKQKVKWFKTDVYSFAVMCYQILSLQQPYTCEHGASAFFEELMKGTRPPRPADCHETLFKLMEECWAGDPNARPNFWSICERLEKFKHDLLLQEPGAAPTKGVDQVQVENVASSSSYTHIETMLERRSELRTPANHLAKVVENEGATSESDEGATSECDEGSTSECDEGAISEGDEGDISEGDDAAISKGDEDAIGEGGDGAISEGVDEMEDASQRINGRTQDADQSTRENVEEQLGSSTVENELRALTLGLRGIRTEESLRRGDDRPGLLQFSDAEAGGSSTDGHYHREPELEPKYNIFLSHSGFQKDFAEQLCVDLERQHYKPYFDKHSDSLPIGRKFPKLILQVAQQCEVAVLILSEEFFTRSKWPMMELEAFVEAQKIHYGKISILPVYLGLSRYECTKNEARRLHWISVWRKWAKFDKRINIEKWEDALRVLGSLNGVEYANYLRQDMLRKEIVNAVCGLVQPQKNRLLDKLNGEFKYATIEKFVRTKPSSRYGVRVVGIYGVGGVWKTTLCKLLCDDLFAEYEGKVCHVELGIKSPLELQKQVLRNLTDINHESLTNLTHDMITNLLKQHSHRHQVFLALDNVSLESVDEAKVYLQAGSCHGSIILVSAPSINLLGRLQIDESDCMKMHMPELEEEDAKRLYLYHAPYWDKILK